jgi:hypothetical protein
MSLDPELVIHLASGLARWLAQHWTDPACPVVTGRQDDAARMACRPPSLVAPVPVNGNRNAVLQPLPGSSSLQAGAYITATG